MNTRPIPSTGEALPVIGCGTYIGFDHAPGSPEYALLPGVVGALLDAGGKVLDSSPMYGRAEATTGELLAASGRRAEAFLATKVWTQGRAEGVRQMEASMRLLRSRPHRPDADPQPARLAHSPGDAARVEGGRPDPLPRHHPLHVVGVRRRRGGAARGEARLPADQLRARRPRGERRLLPLAAERGVAVIVNMPFGGGGLLRGLLAKPLPSWAAEIGCASWAQLLLKFVLSHPAVTCAIPGTRRREHMEDNVRAGFGSVPPPEFWRDKLATIGR
jgi:diketogulonate reductase-like aldo/keto reductase